MLLVFVLFFSTFTPGLFQALPHLQVLDLSGNLDCYNGDSFSPGVFESSSHLTKLDLRLREKVEGVSCSK